MITLLPLALVAAAPLGVVTISSTNDSNAACVLDAAAKCTWRSSSTSGDRGVDEGIGIRFDAPLGCSDLEVALQAPATSAPVDASFGAYGATLTATGAVRDGAKTWTAKCSPSNTLFLRVVPGARAIEIASVRFLRDGKPMELALPRQVKATVTATSVLAPKAAYQPAHLFDAKTDLAWATDGKKTDGKGATVTVTLDEPVELGGVILWNGYQRSPTHFSANSRVRSLTIKAGGQSAQLTVDASSQGMDRKVLPTALPSSKVVELVVNDVVRGDKYRDLVISELRFLDKAGRVVAPVVPVEKTAAPAGVALDTSFAGAVASVEGGAMTYCVDRRLRVRSGGSFVIYTGDENNPLGTGVVEGGWEPAKSQGALRVFGKKYRTVVSEGEYGGVEEVVPEIFQSELQLVPFASLGAREQSRVVDVALDLAGTGDNSFTSERKVYGRDGKVLASASSSNDLKKALTKALMDANATAAVSSVYTDVLLPTDTAGACKR